MFDVEIPWETIEEAALDAGLEPESDIYRAYSGRFMYGRSCLGVVGTINQYTEFLLAMERSDCGDEYTNKMAENVTTDNMGRQTIFYFPGITVLEDEDEILEGC